MITHKFAVVCAEVIRDYCKENYSCKDGRCPGCVFSYPGNRSCYLQMFVGVDGKEMQDVAKEKVEQRLKGLNEIRRHSDNQRGEV